VRLPLAIIVVGVLIGVVVGVGSYTFIYAKGYSYITNNPAACANCHVMQSTYAAWSRGPHRSVAVCNDCHTPHDLLGKYLTKASNGFRHSFYFTTGRYPDAIEITPRNRAITENNCHRCHQPIVDQIEHGGRVSCIRCHDDAGHM